MPTKRQDRRVIICSRCHEDRPHQAHGLCDSCYSVRLYGQNPAKGKEKAQRYRQRHPEVVQAQTQRYQAEHAEALKEARKQWGQKNKPLLAATARRYRRNNPQKVKERNQKHWQANREEREAAVREWIAANRERHRLSGRIRSQRRRTLKHMLPATLTSEQWEAIKVAYHHRCAYCGTKPEKLTQDHVIPISKGGGYTADNIVPACGSCNSSKGTRAPKVLPAVRLLV